MYIHTYIYIYREREKYRYWHSILHHSICTHVNRVLDDRPVDGQLELVHFDVLVHVCMFVYCICLTQRVFPGSY